MIFLTLVRINVSPQIPNVSGSVYYYGKCIILSLKNNSMMNWSIINFNGHFFQFFFQFSSISISIQWTVFQRWHGESLCGLDGGGARSSARGRRGGRKKDSLDTPSNHRFTVLTSSFQYFQGKISRPHFPTIFVQCEILQEIRSHRGLAFNSFNQSHALAFRWWKMAFVG